MDAQKKQYWIRYTDLMVKTYPNYWAKVLPQTSDSIQTKKEIAQASSIEPESSSRSYTLSSPKFV